MNIRNFSRMARGDTNGFSDLALDFFNDTRRVMSGWMALIETGNFARVREELHRCKGGASLFGFERLVELIGASESPRVLETRGFNLAAFEKELRLAERAVVEMMQPVA
jgi:HPt (histidine-containing phosphotransfer) domain-containing protein